MGNFKFYNFVWFIAFLIFAITLNLQLLDASNVHTSIAAHDEYLTVKQVYSILEPYSFKHFVVAVTTGDKLYYGRVMFYVDAFFAYIPYKIWGVEGMVFAIRMVHALLMALAFWILARTFIKNRWMQLLFLLLCSIGFYTNYFIMLPKPEPFQLFFLAMFLNRWKKQNWQFGTSFVWLGLAYGAKFNVLFLLPIIFLVAFVPSLQPGNYDRVIVWSKKFLGGIKGLIWFLVGFVFAIPGMLAAVVKPQIFKTYLNQTIFGTNQIDDDATVTVWQWLMDVNGNFFWGNKYLFFGLFLLICFVLYGIFSIKRKNAGRWPEIWVLFLVAIFLFFPVVVLTKRLWPHYIWEGHVFWVLCFFVAASNLNLKDLKITRLVYWSILAILVFASLRFLFVHQKSYYGLDEKYAIEKRDYQRILQYIESKTKNPKIVQEMKVYYPFKEFVKVDRFNPTSQPIVYPNNTHYISWAIPENPESVDVWSSYDYVIVQPRVEKSNDANQKIAEQNNVWMQKFTNQMGKTLLKDTVLCNKIIYKIKTK